MLKEYSLSHYSPGSWRFLLNAMDVSLLIWGNIAWGPGRVACSIPSQTGEGRTDEHNKVKMGCEKSVLSVTQMSLPGPVVKSWIAVLHSAGSWP